MSKPRNLINEIGDIDNFITWQGVKDEKMYNPDKAAEQAAQLYQAGEAKLGTDEDAFVEILAHAGQRQAYLLFEEYKKLSGRTIEQAMQDEMDGELLTGLLALGMDSYSNKKKKLQFNRYNTAFSIDWRVFFQSGCPFRQQWGWWVSNLPIVAVIIAVKTAANRPQYFAERLNTAMEGCGTDDSVLINIIVGRCEIDLANIKYEYERLYGKTLLSSITVIYFGFHWLLNNLIIEAVSTDSVD